ncbi:uncharacterized protein LOC128406054 [Podarcis raffonei]|uniref:uncharacterized protein LOC128406054 n=1 Tax=Podarcis raffonei TaxID=65483 RepID=UPI00232987C0|nr:uncharacterized protein LOC128406054 [Podarcis raffonei]
MANGKEKTDQSTAGKTLRSGRTWQQPRRGSTSGLPASSAAASVPVHSKPRGMSTEEALVVALVKINDSLEQLHKKTDVINAKVDAANIKIDLIAESINNLGQNVNTNTETIQKLIQESTLIRQTADEAREKAVAAECKATQLERERVPALQRQLDEHKLTLVMIELKEKQTNLRIRALPELEKESLTEFQEETGLTLVEKERYLGVSVTAKNVNLFKDNCEGRWIEVKGDLEIWTNLKLSLLGRVAVVGMSVAVLPGMLLLFQTLQVSDGMDCFRRWQRDVSRFVWQGKKPRVKFKILTDAKEGGGFALPDLKLCCEPAAFCWLREWLLLENTEVLDNGR